MSRHRYVRNLDLDAEMADEDSEEESGMTEEEKAQMATSMPIARELLKDIKPPVGDNAIADALWHYWFDIEKAVGYLRKDWEKKGESPPDQLLPTPEQQRRRRAVKSPRRDPGSSTQVPLSALQRLSISRKEASTSISHLTNDTASIPQPHDTSVAEKGSKPMSKLALLAQKRKEAAQNRGLSSIATSSPTTPTSLVTSTESSAGPSKPLSKLAQKMAAARAAKVEAAAVKDESSHVDQTTTKGMEGGDDGVEAPVDEMSDLFPSSPPTQARSTPFFQLLTATTYQAKPPDTTPSAILHLPFVSDQEELEKRIRKAFGPGVDSPDDIVLKARSGRMGTADSTPTTNTTPTAAKVATGKKKAIKIAKASAPPTPKSASLPGKPRTAQPNTKPKTQPNTPKSKQRGASTATSSGSASPMIAGSSGLQNDLAGLHLTQEVDDAEREREREKFKEKPGLNMKQEELVAKVKKEEEESGKKGISLIVVGHVDAGKSTLMGRLLYDLGELSEKERTANERGSKRVGKSSFAYAWGLDALGDERDRGVTIDIATTHFATLHRSITLLDAPGHRDFIPAMISGAAQADVALMVVDGSPGEFEAGFERGGQTREHAWLVRSLGVKEIVVGVNKMDVVKWSQDRYEDIVEAMKPFLTSAGFAASKTTFLPLAAMEGVNVLSNEDVILKEWYSGPTLIDTLDKVEVPQRPYDSPLRIPVSNVFKGQTAIASGVAVSGRLCSGVLQVGDRVRAIPGDEVATVRTIELDDDSAPYAVAGQNVTLYLSGIDPIHLGIGTVLCPTSQPVPMVNSFTAQILVFDLSSPIITGTAVELFHHSMNLPATISKLISISERGVVTKQKPRVLQKGVTATVEISLRSTQNNSSGRVTGIPLETAAQNKEMGRVLIRRSGETIAAGVILELGS